MESITPYWTNVFGQPVLQDERASRVVVSTNGNSLRPFAATQIMTTLSALKGSCTGLDMVTPAQLQEWNPGSLAAYLNVQFAAKLQDH
ncbi:hypothetical protein P879_10014 [Paragonimus westermani]|uniref:Uncharacterized protein n=1 Tax=Paragonimus westermani TaxID=34504 RepID=A0A8T0DIX8_9TREM|nr:hypothetical protein P879_10014 [Paragonimus westermani]